MDASVVDKLKLAPMTLNNKSKHHTNFTTSIEARDFVSTGISAADRAYTIRTAARPDCRPEELIPNGHIFPLRAKRGGVLERTGHTELSTDLVILAGLSSPCAVICEIMAIDGSMARSETLQVLSNTFDLPMVSVEDVIAYRRHFGFNYISKVPQSAPDFKFENSGFVEMPLAKYPQCVIRGGSFRSSLWNGNQEILVLLFGDESIVDCIPLVRVHSQCLTGDVLGSMRCDCGDQLQLSIERLSLEKFGILMYVPHHEGRGIGIFNKICAYKLQDEHALDTLDANVALDLPIDARNYEFVAHILLQQFRISKIRLLTNNPDKIKQLQNQGIEVIEREKLSGRINAHNERYLNTKCTRLGHCIDKI